jgi:chromosome segregation protein
MYLSKIEVIGFKSFAQRTNLNFDAGVTAIVGPNGCGKTNIVDAIRWALGEQRYSTLRSDKMEDVIFNGTKSRKPLGLAEVSLSIENTKGILPTEYSEVTVTRRVFRSGESEYLLNKVPCRLKDILDLFMDTGMGSDAYSVIELKMVETILSDKTDERRRLFEEAAGVTKYKFRRKAAMRKLESVQQDLMRVNDIVKEVQKTVNSLERQAKRAEQYNEVSAELKGLEIDLLEREYAHLHGKLVPLEERFAYAQTDKSSIHETLQSQEERADQLGLALSGIEQQLQLKQRDTASQFELIHRAEERILVANERSNSLVSNIERYEQEKTALQGQQERLAAEQATLRASGDQLRRELASSEVQFAEMKERRQALGRTVEGTKSEVDSYRGSILTLAHELVEKRGERERITERIHNLQGRIDRANEENALYETDIQKNSELVAQLTSEDRELRKRFVEAEVKLLEREKAKKELNDEVDRLQKESDVLKNEMERKASRIDFLRKMVESNEGYSEGARYLLGSEKWIIKNLATVADLVQAEGQYRVAIEAALGDAAHMLVVRDVKDGYAALDELRRQDKGKATFISLDWVPRVTRRIGRSSRKRRNHPLQYVWAPDVVHCDPVYRPLINFLLQDVAIVATLDAVAGTVKNFAGVRCVTLDGEVVTATGTIRGGSKRFDEGGLIGKKSQIAELEQGMKETGVKLAGISDEIRKTKESSEALELKSFVGAVKKIEKEMAAIEMRIAQIEFEKGRARDAVDRNMSETALLQGEIRKLRQQHETATGDLAASEQRKTDHEAMAQSASRELEKLEIEWSDLTRSVNELEIKVVTLQGDIRNTERDVERGNARTEDIRVTLLRRDHEINHAREEITRLSSQIATQTEELAGFRQSFQQLEEEVRGIEETHSSKRNELHQIELKMKDERRMHDDSVSAAHELEMKISELKSGVDHLKERAREEFELELQLKSYPDNEFVDFAQLRDEIKGHKDRIRVLGAINFAAFDEFKGESERLAFLTGQRDDLLEAEKTLLSTIEEINTTAQKKFSDTFAKIRENFIATFKELFQEGDDCDLRIEEGVDPLEANIEIIAKPRGKRPTSIDLLSGGEKTLTAIALLFAIYLVKPSPFCILDEVDAPLDDSNIDRYTRILKKFSNNTQFIVVTHNKRTMEAASALYGVTMEEEGISKIVTVRFNEEARLRSAAVSG